MKIQFFKNKDLILKELNISDKLIKKLNLENDIETIKNSITSLFVLEKDINDSDLLKVIVVGYKNKCKVYFLDNKHIVSNINIDIEDFINVDNIEEYFIKFYKENKIINISPYKLNENIKMTFSNIIEDIHRVISFYSKAIDTRSFNLIKHLYKSDSKNVVNYLQNICFKHLDIKLFKECYPYNLHSNKIKSYCLYNLLSNDNEIKENFLDFKRKHSFLSMVFINKTPTFLNLNFKKYSEEKVLNRIQKRLKTDFKFLTDKQFEYLKYKSYNHFLYLKTPEKYFTYIEKAELTDIDYLNLNQLKFIRKVFIKNRTYILPKEIKTIILDEVLMDRVMNVLSYREYSGGEINCKIENIEEFIIENNHSLKRTRDSFIYSVLERHNMVKQKELILDNFMDKKIKIKLIDTELLKNDFNLFDEGKKTKYSNVSVLNAYYSTFFNILKNDYCYIFSLKEGRQDNIFIVKFIFSSGKFESIIDYTPRLKKITDNILSSDEFKSYFFENFIY